MKYGNNKDHYTYDNGVLINKLNIKEQNKLELAERSIVSSKNILLLENNNIKESFDLEHLKNMHKFLFNDIYEWAGRTRDISISKGETLFASPTRIEPELNKLFQQLKQDNYLKGLKDNNISSKLAYYMGELNAIHPFREGNGRTQRIFTIQLARNANYNLDITHMTQKDMTLASIEAMNLNYKPLQNLIEKGLKPIIMTESLNVITPPSNTAFAKARQAATKTLESKRSQSTQKTVNKGMGKGIER